MAALVELAIDRTSLSLPDLLLASDRSTALSITSYTEPALVSEVTYAPSSAWVHGESALATRYAQTGLAFTVGSADAANESDSRAALDDLAEAIGRLSYSLTQTIDDVERTWACLPGSITPAGPRTYRDLRTHRAQWQVAIPAYPIPS